MSELITIQYPAKAPTLANAVQEYLLSKFKGKALQTRRTARLILEEFEIFLGNRPIDRLALLQWDERQEKKGLQASTINVKGRHIRAFLRWCEDMGYIEKAPIKMVVSHHVRAKPLPSIFTQQEYERIKEFTRGTNHYFMTIVGYYTGMSMVDVCYLRWACVDMERLFIETNRIKMAWRGPEASHFMVPFLANSDLHILLQEIQGEGTNKFNNANDGFVHPDLKGAYDYRSAMLAFSYHRMLKKLGITGKSFKNWRNTFMSHVANSGANMGLAVKLTGHKDPSVYAAYIKPDVEALRNIVQAAFQWAQSKETVKQLRTTKPSQ